MTTIENGRGNPDASARLQMCVIIAAVSWTDVFRSSFSATILVRHLEPVWCFIISSRSPTGVAQLAESSLFKILDASVL